MTAAPSPAPIIQTQGIHHITFMGADRQTSMDFWQGVLGMAFVFEQPNLDDETQNHLYFDPGDGRLITIFTSEDWPKDSRSTPLKAGSLHHLAQQGAVLERRGGAAGVPVVRGLGEAVVAGGHLDLLASCHY